MYPPGIPISGTSQALRAKHEAEAEEREIHAPLRAVGQLVPQRKVEEDPEAQIGHHHHGNHVKPGPIVLAYEMLEHRQEEHDSQKNQKAEEDKELLWRRRRHGACPPLLPAHGRK